MKTKAVILLFISLAVLMLAVAVGSVTIPPGTIGEVISARLLGRAVSPSVEPSVVTIIWNLRLPRVLLAFAAGAALAVSGAVCQSVLRNPLASSYTIGVSAGAALGVGVVMMTGLTLPLLGRLTLPFMGLASGLAAVFLAVLFAARMDASMGNQTLILVGMVFSVFMNACLTLLASFSRNNAQRMLLWQAGSFSGRDWTAVWLVLFPTLVGTLILWRFSRELDLLTFGEEHALSAGLDAVRVKWLLLGLSSALTGITVAFAGIIGFVDLMAPHMVRRVFGPAHRLVLPMSALAGGILMVLADLLARWLIAPSEIPVGVVTALIGAPVFVYIYLTRRQKEGA